MTSEQLALSRPVAGEVEYVAAAPRHTARYSQKIVCQLLAFVECVAVGVVATMTLSNRGQFPQPGHLLSLICGVTVAAIALASLACGGGLRPDRFASRSALLPGALATALFTALVAHLTGANTAYTILAGATLFAAVYIAKVPTVILVLVLQSAGRLTRLVAVASDDAGARRDVITSLRQRNDVEIVFSGSPYALKTLCKLAQNDQLDEIVIADREAGAIDIAPLADLPVTLVRVLPDDRMLARRMRPAPYIETAGPWNGPAAIIATPPLSGWQGATKRGLDILGGVTALILFSPVLMACAIAIKLDSPGPVFFVQDRAGYRSRPFRMLKFRSMHAAMADPNGSQLTQRVDPRVTRVGAFLRRTSLDELPQIFNVLAGSMSLVGPRPHPSGARAGGVLYDELIPNFYSRYRMKPGITGLAQVCGLRGNTETQQSLIDRYRKDVEYANNWLPHQDLIILLRTVHHLIGAQNAF